MTGDGPGISFVDDLKGVEIYMTVKYWDYSEEMHDNKSKYILMGHFLIELICHGHVYLAIQYFNTFLSISEKEVIIWKLSLDKMFKEGRKAKEEGRKGDLGRRRKEARKQGSKEGRKE